MLVALLATLTLFGAPNLGDPQLTLHPPFMPVMKGAQVVPTNTHSDPVFTDFTEHRANRVLHFALELGVWSAFGYWGYDQTDGYARYALMIGLPLATIVSWTAFSVPRDPWLPGGRDGQQPWVEIPGWLRFTYEVAVHGLAAWALYDLGWTEGAYGMGGAFIVHYSVSYQRVAWLFGAGDSPR